MNHEPPSASRIANRAPASAQGDARQLTEDTVLREMFVSLNSSDDLVSQVLGSVSEDLDALLYAVAGEYCDGGTESAERYILRLMRRIDFASELLQRRC